MAAPDQKTGKWEGFTSIIGGFVGALAGPTLCEYAWPVMVGASALSGGYLTDRLQHVFKANPPSRAADILGGAIGGGGSLALIPQLWPIGASVVGIPSGVALGDLIGRSMDGDLELGNLNPLNFFSGHSGTRGHQL